MLLCCYIVDEQQVFTIGLFFHSFTVVMWMPDHSVNVAEVGYKRLDM
jgi:hypothetical protein